MYHYSPSFDTSWVYERAEDVWGAQKLMAGAVLWGDDHNKALTPLTSKVLFLIALGSGLSRAWSSCESVAGKRGLFRRKLHYHPASLGAFVDHMTGSTDDYGLRSITWTATRSSSTAKRCTIPTAATFIDEWLQLQPLTLKSSKGFTSMYLKMA